MCGDVCGGDLTRATAPRLSTEIGVTLGGKTFEESASSSQPCLLPTPRWCRSLALSAEIALVQARSVSRAGAKQWQNGAQRKFAELYSARKSHSLSKVQTLLYASVNDHWRKLLKLVLRLNRA